MKSDVDPSAIQSIGIIGCFNIILCISASVFWFETNTNIRTIKKKKIIYMSY